jgi:hypothetical protein
VSSDSSNTYTPTVLRFHTNGSLDTTFGSAGLSQFLAGPYCFVANVTLQGNNKIVASIDGLDATATVEITPVVRLTNAGQLDPAFGTSGSMSVTATAPLGSGWVGVNNVSPRGR